MALKNHCASGPGMRSEGFVEPQPSADQAVVREVTQLRPGHLYLTATGNQA